MSVLLHSNKESRMGPRVSVCRKGENIFLTIEGDINFDSSQELLAVVRQMMNTLMKCAAPETRMNYRLKTRATVDLDKIAQVQEENAEPPASPRTRRGLTLVKGGAL
jgi:hypothetical protein